MKRTIASVPLLALVMLTLAGCGPTPPPGDAPVDPRPTPTGSPTPIPLPSPSETLPPEALDPLDTVTRILLQTRTLSFCDDLACGVDGFRYDDSPETAITKLTGVFGFAPAGERYDNGDGSVSTYYAWDQFMLYVTTEGDVLTLPMGVSISAASVGDIVVETEHGVRVGTPWTEAAEVADSVDSFADEMEDVWEARFDVTPTGTSGEFEAIIAFGNVGGGGGPITSIMGPITTAEFSG